MRGIRSCRFVATLVTGAAVAFACAAFAQRSPAVESSEVAGAVKAGVDRVVVLGGKTYLAGELSGALAKEGGSGTAAWSKISGPGTVAFADAGALATTATFSDAGNYVLKLTATKGPVGQSSTVAVRVIAPPPPTRLDPVDTKRYKVDSPFWNARVKAQIVHWIPHCIDKLNDPALKEGGINNIVAAADKLAGRPRAQHVSHVASDGWVYNTLESICLAVTVDPQGDAEIIQAQKAMKATLEDWIPKILAAQEPDGYLQTFFTLSGRERWSPKHRCDHEGYVAGYFLDAAVAHFLATNQTDARLYRAAKKLADCWCDNLGPPPKKAWYDGHQAMEMALVRFGRLVSQTEGKGKGDKYIELAKFLLDCRKDGSQLDQSHVPVIRQYEAVGHAVRASYTYAGMAGVAMQTGDVDYHSAVASIWDNLVNRKYYVTGGIGSGESPEGFGPDYSLPQMSYCEACSSCGEVFFQHQMNMLCHDAKYADLYEETLYNAVLGSIDLQGKNFYYRNLLNSQWARYPWHACPCCVGNIPRTLLMLPTWTYTKSADGICVNLFIGSTVTVPNVAGTDVEMVQVTDYPWSGKVSITVTPAAEKQLSVRIRAPNRSVSDLYAATPRADGITSIALNGAAITPPVEKGYAVITRKWKAGDKIDLVLPMKIQRVKGIDKIAATLGRVALRYGPLIYNVERVDQDLENALNPQSALLTEWRGDLLGGVLVVKGAWANGAALTAIPHYARENRSLKTAKDRSVVRSAVWLKDQMSGLRTEAAVPSRQGHFRSDPRFRIPAMVATAKGTLLAFCEGRMGLFYEKDGYKTLTLATFPLQWLADPAAAPRAPTEDPTAAERQKAKAALEEAIPRAARDPARPRFHFRPPARWMNDVCGAIHYHGYYHVFYQNNPFSDDEWGWGWGHARSKDLVHWEELPFALAPMKHRGERRCNSGCVTLDGSGRPIIFYTFVPQAKGPKRTQWAAVPLDEELIQWQRVGNAPLMEPGSSGVPADVNGGWSDPYVFKSQGRTLVTFKSCGGLVCEAQDQALTRWKCIGKLDGVEGECPNVVQFQDKWAIIRSTWPISYVTGDLVLKENHIRFDANGPARTLDYGFGKHPPKDRPVARGLYGTSTFDDAKGRTILCGWVSGFKTGRGWNGCMSLPRVLALDKSGRIIQTPAPELQVLRGRRTSLTALAVDNEFQPIKGAAGNQFELVADLDPGNAAACGLKLCSSSDGKRGIMLRYAEGMLNVAGTEMPLELGKETKTLKLHVFLDRSVLEVFINDGRAAVTRVEYPDDEDLGIAVFAEGGKAVLKSLDVWPMKAIW